MLDKTDLCLRRMVTPQSEYFMQLYRFYKQGHLAVSGGVTDQPGIYLEAIEIIGSWLKDGGT